MLQTLLEEEVTRFEQDCNVILRGTSLLTKWMDVLLREQPSPLPDFLCLLKECGM